MCGRFAATSSAEAIRALLRTTNPTVNVGPSWNVAPSDPAMVVRRHPRTGERHLDALRWGLVPGFTGAMASARRPINARSETAARSGLFGGALAARRCLVPAAAFYEWRTMADGKQPYAVARHDGGPLALAGLWEGWRAPDGETLRSFAILTTRANGVMAALHDRMPVIVEPADWACWLGEADGDALALMRPAAEAVLRLWPVSRAVNSVRNNGAALLDRIDDPQAPPPSDRPSGQNPL